ncbi:MAG: GtrA family protein [Patescibacteria group bacterium]|nr:GtrA family protein [Patescibacteria group bacterium]
MATRKDFLLVFIIGVFFGVFSLPIIKNVAGSFSFSWVLATGFVFLLGVVAVFFLWLASLISLKIPIVFQLAKFAAVGSFNTFLDWGIVNLLIFLTGIVSGLGFSLFKAISFLIANIGSYFWNKYWTFIDKDKANIQEFGKFFVVSVIGMVLNVVVASLIVNYIAYPSSLSPRQWANVALLVATLVSLVWNFVGYKFFVFEKKN